MTPTSMFLLAALAIVAVPVVLLRVSGLKGLMPLVVVQIFVGIALGPSIFGRIAPDYFDMFASPQTLTSFSGVAFIAVLIFRHDLRLCISTPTFLTAPNDRSGP